MAQFLPSDGKRTEHETNIRSLVGCAHEVRVHLHDSKVVVGSVIPATNVDAMTFVIRPWGRTLSMTIRFDEVLRAAIVKQINWHKQRAISAAQVAGVFTESAGR